LLDTNDESALYNFARAWTISSFSEINPGPELSFYEAQIAWLAVRMTQPCTICAERSPRRMITINDTIVEAGLTPPSTER
jgi:hypothetical protein